MHLLYLHFSHGSLLFLCSAAKALNGGSISIVPNAIRASIRPTALVSGDMYAATDEDGTIDGFTMRPAPGKMVNTTCVDSSGAHIAVNLMLGSREREQQMGLHDTMNLYIYLDV